MGFRNAARVLLGALAALFQGRMIRVNAVGDSHLTVAVVERKPSVFNVMINDAFKVSQANGQVVIRAAQQKSGADGRLCCTRLVARKGALRHVVCGAGRVHESFRWKFAHGILPPRAVAARLATIPTPPPLLSPPGDLDLRGASERPGLFSSVSTRWRCSPGTPGLYGPNLLVLRPCAQL